MAFCAKCGAQLNDGVAFCPACGAPTAKNNQQQTGQRPGAGAGTNFASKINDLNNTPDYTSQIDPNDAAQNKVFGVLAYLGLLVLITIFAAPKNSRYSRFHANQGLMLAIISVGYSIVSSILCAAIKVPMYVWGVYTGSYTPAWLLLILGLISIPLIVLAIIGIVNAATGKCKELPVIGGVKILK